MAALRRYDREKIDKPLLIGDNPYKHSSQAA